MNVYFENFADRPWMDTFDRLGVYDEAYSPRRPLSPKEKAKRNARNKMAKESRKRNRR